MGMLGKMIRWSLIGLTAITFLGFVPAFNWMYCVNHSYAAWMPNGILKATGHGIAWPVYIWDLRRGPGYYAKQALVAAEQVDREVAGWAPNQLPSSEQLDAFDLKLMDAIEQARLIDYAYLNERYPEMGDHFEREFLGGMVRTHKGIQNRESMMTLSGLALIARFAEWYNAHVDSIRAQF